MSGALNNHASEETEESLQTLHPGNTTTFYRAHSDASYTQKYCQNGTSHGFSSNEAATATYSTHINKKTIARHLGYDIGGEPNPYVSVYSTIGMCFTPFLPKISWDITNRLKSYTERAKVMADDMITNGEQNVRVYKITPPVLKAGAIMVPKDSTDEVYIRMRAWQAKPGDTDKEGNICFIWTMDAHRILGVDLNICSPDQWLVLYGTPAFMGEDCTSEAYEKGDVES